MAYANASFRQVHWPDLPGTPSRETIMRRAHQHRQGVLIETADIDSWVAAVRRRDRRQPQRTSESDLNDVRWMRVTEETASDGWPRCGPARRCSRLRSGRI